MDMICYMHEGNPYGYLKVGEKVIHADNLARMVGEPSSTVQGWLDELQEASVFDLDDGVICSRRMIRDEELRQKRANGGKLGGNPSLKVNHKVEKEVKQKQTPSSSSSSTSSSTSTTKIQKPEGVLDSTWNDFVTLRKSKKAAITQTSLNGIYREAMKAGISLEQALRTCCERGWQGFKADWVSNLPKPTLAQQSTLAAARTIFGDERNVQDAYIIESHPKALT
jgi:hypothetical protein